MRSRARAAGARPPCCQQDRPGAEEKEPRNEEEPAWRHGYPALTRERKAKILGLNAARVYGVDVAQVQRAQAGDEVSRARAEYANAPMPSFQTYGPRTRRDMLRLLDFTCGMPD